MDGGTESGYPNYVAELDKCKEFLLGFQALGEDTRKYQDLMQQVVNRQEKVVEIEVDDVLAFRNDAEFADNIVANTGRYMKMFSQAVDESLPPPSVDVEQLQSPTIYTLVVAYYGY